MEGSEDKGKYGWDEGGSVGCSERCEVCSRVAETSSRRGEERERAEILYQYQYQAIRVPRFSLTLFYRRPFKTLLST